MSVVCCPRRKSNRSDRSCSSITSARSSRARRRPRCPPASAHRARDGDVSVRGRDAASRQPRFGPAHRAGRDQLDDRGLRHRAFRAHAAGLEGRRLHGAWTAALGRVTARVRGDRAVVSAHGGRCTSGVYERRPAGPGPDRRRVRPAFASHDLRADTLPRRRSASRGEPRFAPRARNGKARARGLQRRPSGDDRRRDGRAVRDGRADRTQRNDHRAAGRALRRHRRRAAGRATHRLVELRGVEQGPYRTRKQDWTQQRMGKISGEHEWIPLPQ